ncbi:hypothetical protein FRC02_001930 [Tulasnella sp. 418]|nr:hypothetical protein FRC02_001930 [Tulasnella sp. 418]
MCLLLPICSISNIAIGKIVTSHLVINSYKLDFARLFLRKDIGLVLINARPPLSPAESVASINNAGAT